MSGKGKLSSSQIRSWLITALLVFVGLNILFAIIREYIPIIVVGILLITIYKMLRSRGIH